MQNQKLNPAKTFFWIDIFSISQHVAHQNQVDENNDVEIKTRDAIRNVEGVILILSSWKAPLALSRTWCLWEILCSLSAKRPLEIYMPGLSRWHRVTPTDFRSFDGKRRIQGEEYEGHSGQQRQARQVFGGQQYRISLHRFMVPTVVYREVAQKWADVHVVSR